MKKSKDPEIVRRRMEFKDAIARVINRLNPPTLGACHYCGWPIVDCYFGPSGRCFPTCTICLHLLDDLKLHRIWEDECPACNI